MILWLDDNMLMLIELLPSLMIILLIFLIQRCVWDVFEVSLRCQTCVFCLLYSCILPCMMYDVYLSINVTMLEVASIWVVCSPLLMIPKLIQNPADQAQCKWLVFPQCTWGQWNPIPLCNTFGAQCGAQWTALGSMDTLSRWALLSNIWKHHNHQPPLQRRWQPSSPFEDDPV